MSAAMKTGSLCIALGIAAISAWFDVQAQAPFANLIADMPAASVPFKASKDIIKRSYGIPDTPYYLFVASFGGPTDHLTDMLVLVDSKGEVLDTLEASVWYFPGIAVRQYEIAENYDVIVHMLNPLASDSISFAEFDSFAASRMSRTYKIADGKFVLRSEKNYRPQIYTRSRLEQESYNIWNGQEQVI